MRWMARRKGIAVVQAHVQEAVRHFDAMPTRGTMISIVLTESRGRIQCGRSSVAWTHSHFVLESATLVDFIDVGMACRAGPGPSRAIDKLYN